MLYESVFRHKGAFRVMIDVSKHFLRKWCRIWKALLGVLAWWWSKNWHGSLLVNRDILLSCNCLLTSKLEKSASFTFRATEHFCHHMKSSPVYAFYMPTSTEFCKESCKMASKPHNSPEKYTRPICFLTKSNRINVHCGATVPGKHQHSDSFFQSTVLSIKVSSSHLIRN